MIQNNFAEHNGKTIADYKVNIGKRVCKTTMKTSGEPKPFRSGHRTNTVIDVIEHPKMHVPAYLFAEDDTYVECRRCKVVNDERKTRFNAEIIIRIAQNASGVDRFSKDDILDKLRHGKANIIGNESGGQLLIVYPIQNCKVMGEIESIEEPKLTLQELLNALSRNPNFIVNSDCQDGICTIRLTDVDTEMSTKMVEINLDLGVTKENIEELNQYTKQWE